jgi:hypothetical protein
MSYTVWRTVQIVKRIFCIRRYRDGGRLRGIFWAGSNEGGAEIEAFAFREFRWAILSLGIWKNHTEETDAAVDKDR